MKRSILAALILLIAVSSATAAKLYIGPMSGSYGVNLASPYYKTNINNPSYLDTTLDKLPEGYYCKDSMVAGGNLDGIYGNGQCTVTVSCPTGFNFVSQSNNAFVRPFGLLFIISKGDSHSSSTGIIHDNPTLIDSRSQNRFTIQSEGKNAIWFDVVLILPGDLSSDGKSIVIDGKQYPLADNDDYIATVTISIESDNVDAGSPKKLSVSIPFSGFFDSDSNIMKNNESAMNVSISTYPAASNLDIRALSDSQEAKRVADIEMYYYLGENKPTGTAVPYPRMFLSASNSPYDPADGGFELLHSSVGYDTPHTSYNSIGYIVSTQSYTEAEAKNPTVVLTSDGTGYASDNRVYHGDESTTTAGTEPYSKSKGEKEFIFPKYFETKSFSDFPSYYYYHWKNSIYVTLEPMSSGIMYPGIYRDTIYFHVIYD